jgi:hypothetical protein
MRNVRTLQDIRGAVTVPTCPGPATELKTYSRLTVLARERQRLIGQQESWQRRLRQITGRLTEIDAESERLRERLPENAGERRPPRRKPRAGVEFRY